MEKSPKHINEKVATQTNYVILKHYAIFLYYEWKNFLKIKWLISSREVVGEHIKRSWEINLTGSVTTFLFVFWGATPGSANGFLLILLYVAPGDAQRDHERQGTESQPTTGKSSTLPTAY